MGWSAADCGSRTAVGQSRQRSTNRSAPGLSRLGLAPRRVGGRLRPGQSRAAARRAGRGRGKELAPLVDQVEARGERRLVRVVVVAVCVTTRSSAASSQSAYSAPSAGRGPTQAAAWRVEAVGAGGRGAVASARSQQRVELGARERADPHAVAQLGVPQEGQVGAQPGAGRRAAGRLEEDQVPACRPSPVRWCGRSGRRPRRAAGSPARSRRSRGRRLQRTRLQPALRHHPRDGGAHGRRGDPDRLEQAHQGGHRRLVAAGRAGGRRRRRTRPTGRAWEESASPVGSVPVLRITAPDGG